MNNILLVEDDPTLLKLFSEQLTRIGYAVDACADAGVALGLWWQDPRKYRLVITDLSMHPRNGLELAKALRRLECETPILLHSATGNPPTRSDMDAHGITAFLQKPFDIDTLKRNIEMVLG